MMTSIALMTLIPTKRPKVPPIKQFRVIICHFNSLAEG